MNLLIYSTHLQKPSFGCHLRLDGWWHMTGPYWLRHWNFKTLSPGWFHLSSFITTFHQQVNDHFHAHGDSFHWFPHGKPPNPTSSFSTGNSCLQGAEFVAEPEAEGEVALHCEGDMSFYINNLLDDRLICSTIPNLFSQWRYFSLGKEPFLNARCVTWKCLILEEKVSLLTGIQPILYIFCALYA